MPAGIRTPNGLAWGHSTIDFHLGSFPGVKNFETLWTTSAVQEFCGADETKIAQFCLDNGLNTIFDEDTDTCEPKPANDMSQVFKSRIKRP